MVLPLTSVKRLITITLITWIIVSLADLIITNIYITKPFIHFYLLFPSGFPAILIYFIIAYFSILINISYTPIDYIPGASFGVIYIPSPWHCTWINPLKSLVFTLIATILFGLSPLISLPIVIYIFAKRAEIRMLDYPYADSIFGAIRDYNQSFYSNIVELLPKISNVLWHNQLYLRCLFYTAFHLVGHTNLSNEQDRKIYINALMDIMKISSGKNNVSGKMEKEMRNKVQSVYLEYFADKYYDHWYGKASIDGLNGYARGYVYMLCYIFCVEIGLFWISTGVLVYSSVDNDLLTMVWILRDILHLILFVIIIWLYFEQIKSEIKYRFCWRHPKSHSLRYHQQKCYEFMYRILWFNIASDIVHDCIMDIVDINDNEDVKWMEHIIIEYCVGYKSLSNNYYQKMNDVDIWYNIIYQDQKYLSENIEWTNNEKMRIVALTDNYEKEKYSHLSGVFPLKIKMLLHQT